MNSLAKENMNIAVESLKKISETDLADICNITEQAIKAGGGFGWLTIPPIETLKKSTYILCEDTRVSKNLLDRYEIKTHLISNHKFNESKNLNKIISLLKSGEIISLISDAGTPSISDPGSILINECIKENIKIFPIPGPSAVVSAVSISDFSEKFFFYVFFLYFLFFSLS